MPTGLGAKLLGQTGTSTAAAGMLAVANPEGEDILVTQFLVDTLVAATAAFTFNAGIAPSSTGAADNLIDGIDASTKLVFSNLKDGGTNGRVAVKWKSTEFLTISSDTGALGIFSGRAYANYVHPSST